MTEVYLTGLHFYNVSLVRDELNLKSMLQLKREANEYATGGFAYVLEWGGNTLGYLPEVESVRKWRKKEKDKPFPCEAKLKKLETRGKATKLVRNAIEADNRNPSGIWMCRVGVINKDKLGTITGLSIKWGQE